MGATRLDFPEAMKKDSYAWFWEKYDTLVKVYDRIFQVKTSNVAYEKETSAVGTGALVEKAESANITEKSPIEGFTVTIKNREWAKKVTISKELGEDHTKLPNFLKSMMPQWAQDASDTIEQHCADIYNYGGYTAGHEIFNGTIANVVTDASGVKIYDSVQFFAPTGTNHTSKGGTTYYNGLGALSITKANLQSAYNRMTVYNNRREDDTKIRLVPDILLCSPALKFTVDELLKSQDDPTTTNRAINVLHGLIEPIYWHFLTDTDQWQVVKAKFGKVLYMRENPEFDLWEDKDAKNFKMSIYTRFGAGVTNFRGDVSSNYATS